MVAQANNGHTNSIINPDWKTPEQIEEGVFRGLMAAHTKFNANTSLLPFVDGRIGGSGINGRGNSFGDSVGGMGDLDEQCGYPGELTLDWYQKAYARWGIAARVIDLWPDECWAIYPDVYETNTPSPTEFEIAWKELTNDALVFHYLHRIDRLSGIGEYGVLFLGLDDGGLLSRPPVGINKRTGKGKFRKRKLNYVRAFDQSLVRISKTEGDTSNPRFGQPTEYAIQFSGDAMSRGDGGTATPLDTVITGDLGKKLETKVHWTRIIHVADNRETSEVYGVSRLQRVANYLHDIRKVSGGSAEMFHRGGFPGYAFETYPDLASEADLDIDSIKQTITAYQKGYERYLATVGGKWTSLSPQVADPDQHLSWYVKLICLTIGVPVPIFMGELTGHLASANNAEQWKARCSSRQIKYMEPMILRPFANRLIDLGILPTPKVKNGAYFVAWKDLRSLSDQDRVEVALKKIQAMSQYTTGFVNELFPKRLLYTLVFGFTEEEAKAIEIELARDPAPPRAVTDPSLAPKPVGGSGAGRTGKPAKGQVGRPAKTPPEGKPRSTKPSSGAKKVAKK